MSESYTPYTGPTGSPDSCGERTVACAACRGKGWHHFNRCRICLGSGVVPAPTPAAECPCKGCHTDPSGASCQLKPVVLAPPATEVGEARICEGCSNNYHLDCPPRCSCSCNAGPVTNLPTSPERDSDTGDDKPQAPELEKPCETHGMYGDCPAHVPPTAPQEPAGSDVEITGLNVAIDALLATEYQRGKADGAREELEDTAKTFEAGKVYTAEQVRQVLAARLEYRK